jgi:hypothetical protein
MPSATIILLFYFHIVVPTIVIPAALAQILSPRSIDLVDALINSPERKPLG